MSEQNRELAARFFAEICNARKLDVADELFTADHIYHDPASPSIGPGPSGMKQLLSAYQVGFPNASWTVEAMYEAGDTVITRWTGRGTHQADLLGIAPTGRSVEVAGVWIHRIAGGRIVETWNVWDALGMMQQLGVIPALASAAA